MKVNVRESIFTHEGGKAHKGNPLQELKRVVLACLLFENTFYEDGKSIVDRIGELCVKCSLDEILNLAIIASANYRLRHVPLQLLIEALKKKDAPYYSNTKYFIEKIITRPDMMTDLLSLYWKSDRKPICHQLKRGLALAFRKFDRYQISKYNRDTPIKLRDVLFLSHAKPKDKEQEALWKRLIDKKLETPDTWEVALSSGKDKKKTFEDLLINNKLGKLAMIRNLRNMRDVGIAKEFVNSRLEHNHQILLPFQYLAAAKEVPDWEDIIDAAMIQSCQDKEKIAGTTIVLVDVSGSMDYALSAKSKLTRMDAACGIAILLRECCEKVSVLTFSDNLIQVPARCGMALRDAIVTSQPHSGTLLGESLRRLQSTSSTYDRLIVITDEQIADNIPAVKGKFYINNVGSNVNGIGNTKGWTTVTGFSEAIVDYIRELEAQESL